MLLARSNAHVRSLVVSPTRGRIVQAVALAQRRSVKTDTKLSRFTNSLIANTDVAKQLLETGLVISSSRTRNSDKGHKTLPPRTDRSRVNLVDERLCDDILATHGDSLRRHEGCDILDLFPGVGVWSTKLNDFLKPRSHLMLEPDAESVYKPFLEPLLQRPGTRLLDKSGIEWSHFPQFLNKEFLPHQVEQSEEYPPRRNDTLLVTANFSWWPGKKFQGFDSVAKLLLYQCIMSIQNASWFQRYGLVRMLVWVCDPEKHILVPRTIQTRRRLSMIADMFTDWVVEVAGGDTPVNFKYMRDDYMEIESAQNTIERMRKQGIVMPPGRESELYLDALSRKDKVVAGQQPAVMSTKTTDSLERLRAQFKEKPDDKDLKGRLNRARYYLRVRDKNHVLIMEMYAEMSEILRQYKDAKDDKARAAAVKRADELDERLDRLTGNGKTGFPPYRDNMRTFRQSPPVLQWDRRPFEPLQVKADEFLPNVPCALVDIQPKAVHPLIWRLGTDRKKGMPDVWELIVQALATEPSVTNGLRKLHLGADQDLIPHCPSLHDPALNGTPFHSKVFELAGRCLTQPQLEEILEAWVNSPFTHDIYGMYRAGFGVAGQETDTHDVQHGNMIGKMSIQNL